MIFFNGILEFYKHKGENYPFRQTKDPYLIWISEIIFQQTKINQGMSYYLNISKKYPNIESLANADEEIFMRDWQGLGYYSRAKNLLKSAKIIFQQYHGVIPNSQKTLLSLPGIGIYTSSAILSFAYNLPFAVVDGNVYRVLSRYFGIETPIDTTEGKKLFQAKADELLPKNNSADYNQGIMEFGAKCCTPKKPLCETCILQSTCVAYNTNKVSSLPFKSKKTKVIDLNMTYTIIHKDGEILIRKRKSGFWSDLHEFVLDQPELNSSNTTFLGTYEHKLSHRNLKISIQFCDFKKLIPKFEFQLLKDDYFWLDKHELENIAFPMVFVNNNIITTIINKL